MDAPSTAADLDRQFGIPGVARLCDGNGGMPRVQITSSLCRSEIYLHGAQVTSWKPAGADEVLFLARSHPRWEEGQAIRRWNSRSTAFPGSGAKGRRSHGSGTWIRTHRKAWQLASITQNQSGVVVSMFTESDAVTKRWWPGNFRLTHRVTFGSELTLELVCTNTGTIPLRFEEALHTYNRVANVQDVRLQGLDGVHFPWTTPTPIGNKSNVAM